MMTEDIFLGKTCSEKYEDDRIDRNGLMTIATAENGPRRSSAREHDASILHLEVSNRRAGINIWFSEDYVNMLTYCIAMQDIFLKNLDKHGTN